MKVRELMDKLCCLNSEDPVYVINEGDNPLETVSDIKKVFGIVNSDNLADNGVYLVRD